MPIVFIVRHGQSKFNAINPNIISGKSVSIGLTSIGREQTYLLANYLANNSVHFDYYFCSSARRAKQTAQIVREVLNQPTIKIHSSADLTEIGQGIWEGKPIIETIYNNKKDIRRFWEFSAPGGGETLKEVETRMYKFWKEHIEHLESNKAVLLISHHTAIKCLLKRIIGLTKNGFERIRLKNSSLSIIKTDDKNQIISLTINEHSFLN